MEANINRASPRKIDELMGALGCVSGICNSKMSRICTGLVSQTQAFLQRPLQLSQRPFVYLDATYFLRLEPARRQVSSRFMITAVAITVSGQ